MMQVIITKSCFF